MYYNPSSARKGLHNVRSQIDVTCEEKHFWCHRSRFWDLSPEDGEWGPLFLAASFFELLRQFRLSSLILFELDVHSFVRVYRVYGFSVFQTYYFARPIAVGGLGRYSLSFCLNRPKKDGDGSLVDTYSIGARIWIKIASYIGFFSSNTEINL